MFRVDSFRDTAPVGWPEAGPQEADIASGTVTLPVNPASPHDREEVGYDWPSLDPIVLAADDVPHAGLYCLMVSDDVGGADPAHTSYAHFVARRRTENTKVLVVFPFATLAAYAGGAADAHNNIYDSFQPRRARRFSIRRPFDKSAFDSKEDVCIQFPHHVVEFLGEAYDPGDPEASPAVPPSGGPGLLPSEIDVCTSFDLHADPDILSGVNLVIIGHDEYWTKTTRDKMEGFVANDGNFMVLSANTAWWQFRLEEASGIAHCTKSALEDPYALSSYEEVSTNFCAVPAAGIAAGGFSNREENTLTGVSYRRGLQASSTTGYTTAFADGTHPYLADTFLAKGATFGSGLIALENDAADFALVSGDPVVTGADGSPLGFEIIAYADLTGDADATQRGKATMGRFTNVGTVFTAGSTHWAKLLHDGDFSVRTITRNVVFDLLEPRTRAAMSLPTRAYPGDAFSQIGGALSGVTPAMAGIVQGQLLLLRDGAHRVMDPENPSAGESAAPAIATLQDATCYGADLWGTWVHAGTSNGTVHYHTGRIYSPAQAWTAWTATAGEPILGIASHNGLPYVVTRPAAGAPTTLRLLVEGGGQMTKLGRVYPPLRALTNLDGVLYGLHDTGTDTESAVHVYARLASASDAVWTRVFDAPAGAYAIAAYYGRIYALAGGPGTSAPTLHWRAAVPDAATPYAPPRVLFVNGTAYGIGTVSYDGTYTHTDGGTLPLEPTKVCRANGGRVFLYRSNGAASLVSFDAAGAVTEVNPWAPGSFGAWDLIVPIRCTYNKDWKDPAQLDVTEKVLFYRQSTGASSIGSFASDGTYVQDTAPAFSSGWTHIACTHEGTIVFYDAASGAVEIGQFDDAGVWHGTGSATIAAGWQDVVATGQAWVVFKRVSSVDAAKTRYELREVLGGTLGASPVQPPDLLGENAFTLIPVVNGVQLVYSPSDGKAAFVGWRSGTVVGSPVVPPEPPAQIPPTKEEDARVALRRYPKGFSSGWGHIISLGAA